jgi:hypothetical protein
MSKTFKVAVLSGDGIGPEVMAEALKVLDAVQGKYGVTFERTFANVGARLCPKKQLMSARLQTQFFLVRSVARSGKSCRPMSNRNAVHCCHYVKFSASSVTCARRSSSRL